MFHVMLVLPLLLIAAVVIAIVLFGIFVIIASIVGGATTAALVKNKTAKKLMFIGLCIVSLIGMACVAPFAAIYAELSGLAITLAMSGAFVCIAVLSIIGIKFSGDIQNNIGKKVLKVIFILVMITALIFAIFVPVVRWLFLSMSA